MTDIPPDLREDLLKVGFTGTQEGLTKSQSHALYNFMFQMTQQFEDQQIVGIHGDCIGADASFFEVCRLVGITTVARPGCNKYGDMPKRAWTRSDYICEREPYLERNHKIVDHCDRLIGCPKDIKEEVRSGTWATIRYARKIERPRTLIFPDGRIVED